MTTLEFHPEALIEFEDAVRYYEGRQVGLGRQYASAVELAIAGILETPLAWPTLEKDVRRRLTRVFPYAILYSVEPSAVFVLAIMHCHRKPAYWHARVDG